MIKLRRGTSICWQPRLRKDRLITFCALTTLFLLLTFLSGWRYSPDLAELLSVAKIYPYTNAPIKALADNSFIVWVVLSVGGLEHARTFFIATYLIAFLFKTSTILRVYGNTPAIIFTLLFFFSVDLNQSRLSLALTFSLLAWLNIRQRKFISGTIYAICSILFHYPVAAFFLFFYHADRLKAKYVISGAASLLFIYFLITNTGLPADRYIAYIRSPHAGGYSHFVLISSAILILCWARITTQQKLISVSTLLICFSTLHLANLSGRLSELLAMGILLASFKHQSSARKNNSFENRGISRYVIIIATLFFFYRATEWILLGNVPGLIIKG